MQREGECGFPDCGRVAHARGLCYSHYRQRSRGEPLSPVRRRRPTGLKVERCTIVECDRMPLSLTLCKPHYDRAQSFGLTPMQLDMLARVEQCAICRRRMPFAELDIDHDHRCCPTGGRSCGNCIRGLLCGACNRALGLFDDDPERLRAALAYLQS